MIARAKIPKIESAITHLHKIGQLDNEAFARGMKRIYSSKIGHAKTLITQRRKALTQQLAANEIVLSDFMRLDSELRKELEALDRRRPR